MANFKTFFTQKREQFGHEWIRKMKPDELNRQSERILNDMARMNFNEDDQKDFVNPVVIEQLIAFANNRNFHYGMLYNALNEYLIKRPELVNTASSTLTVVYHVKYVYDSVSYFLSMYQSTGMEAYILNLQQILVKNVQYISPSKRI